MYARPDAPLGISARVKNLLLKRGNIGDINRSLTVVVHMGAFPHLGGSAPSEHDVRFLFFPCAHCRASAQARLLRTCGVFIWVIYGSIEEGFFG